MQNLVLHQGWIWIGFAWSWTLIFFKNTFNSSHLVLMCVLLWMDHKSAKYRWKWGLKSGNSSVLNVSQTAVKLHFAVVHSPLKQSRPKQVIQISLHFTKTHGLWLKSQLPSWSFSSASFAIHPQVVWHSFTHSGVCVCDIGRFHESDAECDRSILTKGDACETRANTRCKWLSDH